jgi:4-hydroxy-tetrahydrodipicolinate synthase
VVVPYYNKPPQEGMYQYYKAVAAATTKPIVLYNVPGRTGSNMTAETTLRLAQIENIVAVKEASSKRDQILEILQNRPEGFAVLSGNDDETLDLMQNGAEGVISVASNIVPSMVADLTHAMLEGKTVIRPVMHEDEEADENMSGAPRRRRQQKSLQLIRNNRAK